MRTLKAMLSVLLASSLLFLGCPSSTSDKPGASPDITIPLTAVAITDSGLAKSMETAQTFQMAAVLTPADANTGIDWTTTDAAIASVDATGLVTANAAGSVTITAASKLDPTIKSDRTVNVFFAGSLASLSSFKFYNQALVADGSTSALPLLINGKINLVNASNDGLVKASFTKNSMVLYDQAFTGDFRIQVRVLINSSMGVSADRGVTVGAYAETAAGVFGDSTPFAALLYRCRGDVRSFFSLGNAGVINILNEPTSVERVLEVTRTAAGYDFRVLNGKNYDIVATESILNADTKLAAAVQNGNPVFIGFTAQAVDVTFSNLKIWTDLTVGAAPLFETATVAPAAVSVKSVSITGPADALTSGIYEYQNAIGNVPVGGIQLTAAVAPSYADNLGVTWDSSDKTVATVNTAGLVTILKVGSSSISVLTNDGLFSNTYDINITAAVIPVGAITVSGPAVVMAGTKIYMTAAVTPAEATNKAVTWSSNSVNATIDSATGIVTAVSAGPATITATAVDGSSVIGTMNITVSALVYKIWSWTAGTDASADLTALQTVNGKTIVKGAGTVTIDGTAGITLTAGRFNLGTACVNATTGTSNLATVLATSGTVHVSDGEFNFTKKAQVTVTYTSINTPANFTLYINNNTTSDSATGSMLFQAAAPAAVPPLLAISTKLTPVPTPLVSTGGTVVYTIDPAVFTNNSGTLTNAFLQFRVSSGTTMVITGILVEYID